MNILSSSVSSEKLKTASGSVSLPESASTTCAGTASAVTGSRSRKAKQYLSGLETVRKFQQEISDHNRKTFLRTPLLPLQHDATGLLEEYLVFLKKENHFSYYLAGLRRGDLLKEKFNNRDSFSPEKSRFSLTASAKSGKISTGTPEYRLYRQICGVLRMPLNSLEYSNILFLDAFLANPEMRENRLWKIIMAGISQKNDDTGILNDFRDVIIRKLVSLPLPLSRIYRLNTVDELFNPKNVIGYLCLLFNNLGCYHELFRNDLYYAKKKFDYLISENSIRFLGIRALALNQVDNTIANDFIGTDLPALSLHYLIRNRRHHTEKYGLKKFVTKNTNRRRKENAVTLKSSRKTIRRFSLFFCIYEMITGKEPHEDILINDCAFIMAAEIYRQALEFLCIGDVSSFMPVHGSRSKESVEAVTDNTTEDISREKRMKNPDITVRNDVFTDDICCLSTLIKNSGKGNGRDEDAGTVHTSGTTTENTAGGTGSEIWEDEADRCIDRVSEHGFAYKAFTKAMAGQTDFLHGGYSEDLRNILKKELFCTSRVNYKKAL